MSYPVIWQPLLLGRVCPLYCIEFDHAPNISVEQIVTPVKTPVDYICAWAMSKQSSSVYLGGHCSGRHLLSIALTCIVTYDNTDLSLI